MMISVESFYEQNLKGKTAAKILSVIRGLKREISRLKRAMANPDMECIAEPSDGVRLFCTRKYLERAKQALIEVGGVYTPSKAERKAEEFDANIPYICRIEFEIGSYFSGRERRTYRIDGDKLRLSFGHSLSAFCEEVEMLADVSKDEFLERFADLHIGEWRRNYVNPWVLDGTEWDLRIEYSNGHKPIKIEGINEYPYNFDALQAFFGMEEEEEEE